MGRDLSPPALFVGRAREIERLSVLHERIRTGVVYGVPGVGKSTLAQVFASRWTGGVVVQRALPGQSMETLLEDLRRVLCSGAAPAMTSNAARAVDLAARLDGRRALWVLEDLHGLLPSEREWLLRTMPSRLKEGCLLATSRELVSVDPTAPHRVEVKLDRFDRRHAEALWRAYDGLYGTTCSFERGWQLSGGNPLLLRSAHAGRAEAEGPGVDMVARLDSLQLELAGVLALSEVRLDLGALADSWKRPALARDALDALVRMMAVEVFDAGMCALHGGFRRAVLTRQTPEVRRALQRALVDALPGLVPDPVARVREIHRLLLALRDYQDAATFLLSHGADLVRQGAAGELQRGLEAIPPERRSTEVRFAHAGALVRQLRTDAAYDELDRLAREEGGDADVQLALANAALRTGRLNIARRCAQCMHELPELDASLRLRATIDLASVLTEQGEAERARALLVEAERHGVDSAHDRGVLALCTAQTLLQEARFAEALDPVRQARAYLTDSPQWPQAPAAAALMSALVRRHLGDLTQAESDLAVAEAALAAQEDRLTRSWLRAVRARLSFARGDRVRAKQELRAVIRQHAEGGNVLSELWMGLALAEELGRESHWIDRARRRAQKLGLVQLLARMETLSSSLGDEGVLQVEGQGHRLRWGSQTVELRRRPVLRRLFFALYTLAGSRMVKEELAETIWERRYNPRSDDNNLWTNVARLRRALGAFPVEIVSDDGGYRMVVPQGLGLDDRSELSQNN